MGVFLDPVVHFPMSYPWQVSITHPESIAGALAFPAVHPMALDVEEIDDERARAMATQCSRSERDELQHSTGLGLAAACTVLWTAKEAVAKALKTGMTCPMEPLEIRSAAPTGEGVYQGLFPNLVQYKFLAWVRRGLVLTIVLPKKTEIEFSH